MPSTSSASALRASSSTLVNTPLSPVSQPRALDGREHGFLDDPTAQLSAAPKRPPLPEVLVFQSWWNEEDSKPPPNMRSGDGIGRRRQLELRYLTRDGLFQMVTDDAVVPLSLRVDRADGEPMGPHDLHVGRKLDVLGRQTTLMKASAKTIAWIDAEAKRLLRRRTALYDELGRFCDARRALAGAGVPRLYLANPVAPTDKCEIKQGGATSCARLLAEIAALEGLLLGYRR